MRYAMTPPAWWPLRWWPLGSAQAPAVTHTEALGAFAFTAPAAMVFAFSGTNLGTFDFPAEPTMIFGGG